MTFILLQLLLRQREHFLAHHSGHRHFNPLRARALMACAITARQAFPLAKGARDSGQPAIKGKEAARAAMKPMLSDPAFNLTFEIGNVEVARSGDIGYATGPYQLTFTDPVTKKVIEDKGNYVEVYKKQADGSWKSAYDVGTFEVLSAPAPPAKKK
jgi:ketosteroid isomerase-like protein